MASPAPRIPRTPRIGPIVDDAGPSFVPPDVAHQVLLVAHEVAQETLADAERLAAGVLVEAGRQAEALVGEASDAAARSAAQRVAATLAEAINTQHDDIVTILSQVRDDLRSVCEALPPPAAAGPASGRRTSLLAIDPDAVLVRSDEEFLDEVYRRSWASGRQPPAA